MTPTAIDVDKALLEMMQWSVHQQREGVLKLAGLLAQQNRPDACFKLLLNSLDYIANWNERYKQQALSCWHQMEPSVIADPLFDETVISAYSSLAQIKATKASQNGQYGLAAIHSYYSRIDDGEKSTQILGFIKQIRTEKLAILNSQYPQLSPWIEFSLMQRLDGNNAEEYLLKVTQWHQKYPKLIIPEQPGVNDTLPPPTNNVVVMLPLTGQFAALGQAIQDGILTHYFEIDKGNLSFKFIDTATTDTHKAIEYANQGDIVIGPLMKENVASIVPNIRTEIPVLALNRPSDMERETESDNRFFFALRVEDEATQLAELLYQQQLVNPLIVASGGSTSGRMLKEFQKQWQALSQNTNDELNYRVIRYDNTKSMRTNFAKALDIDQSKRRIRHVESMTKGALYSVPRNRRDIDAILLFANAQDTQLLNPIAESSVSPFSDQIPVFSGSRSANSQLTRATRRDLVNLHVVDIPLFIHKDRYQKLWRMTRMMWPERRDGLHRLFAFGYDALKLTKTMRHLRRHPQHSESYLTGDLSVSPIGIVKRQLSVGKIGRFGIASVDDVQ